MSRAAREPKANGGFDFCPNCLHCDSEICDACDDGDQYDEGGECEIGAVPVKKKVVSIRRLKELAFA